MDHQCIVTVADMRDMDERTLIAKNLTSHELMEQAGNACFRYLIKTSWNNWMEPTLVVAGPGNNGGDALVIARLLLEREYPVTVVRVGDTTACTTEHDQAWQRLSPWQDCLFDVSETSDLGTLDQHLKKASAVIDGIFGIGLTRSVEGLYAAVIRRINASPSPVIAIDIASGLHADNGLALGSTIVADHTLVIQHLKPGHLLQDGQDHSGDLHVIDVGIVPPHRTDAILWLSPEARKNRIPWRRHNTHKYHYGNVLTIGGSPGMMGAPVLSAMAAMRTGSGLSRMLHHAEDAAEVIRIYPDLMIRCDLDANRIPSTLAHVDAVLFGPGLGRNREANAKVLDRLLDAEIPLVVDADGLWYLSSRLPQGTTRVPIVVTPHAKELADLLGRKTDEITADPIGCAIRTANEHGLLVVLKGAATIVTDGHVTWVSTHGHPILATAGTGDVLAGILLSLLGRGMAPIDAATLAVLVHAEAAHLLLEHLGEESMVASDLIEVLPQVITQMKP